ncbi:hypothetical protein [Kribbella sp.]|uniref:hypothetical protein n=1 Tax=Kribbella sp. TaxID=1871183 RepID=UPI002D28BA86|nr:hypothetical protein [Kribbella sp.]HZX09011.1 hypothetical protein [Kribbella sp.]
MDLDRRVSPDSFVYQEVERLYKLAQSLRPVTTDRWNRELYATDLDTLGGLDPNTGVLRLSSHRVLMHLTGSVSPERAADQAEALSTVLHESTHGGMHIKAPGEPNAVWTEHSRGVMEGFAEVRAFADFELFAKRAGYGGLTLGDPQYPGAFAATSDLMAHISGPSYSQNDLINDACRGPGLMHFDQFAHAVVANHLTELTHRDPQTQQTIRRQLIEPMLHAHWPTLPNTEAPTGHAVATEIRSTLNTKISELRHQHRLPPAPPTPQTPPTHQPRSAPLPAVHDPAPTPDARQDTLNALRFLTAQPPPTKALHHRPTPAIPHTRPHLSTKPPPRTRD